MKITKEYLLSLGFKECPSQISLPDWYIAFIDDNSITSDAVEYDNDDYNYVITIYFSPSGLIGQYSEDYLVYFKLENQIDLFNFFDDYLDNSDVLKYAVRERPK